MVPQDPEAVLREREVQANQRQFEKMRDESTKLSEAELEELRGLVKQRLKEDNGRLIPLANDLGEDPEPIRGGLLSIDPTTAADVAQLQKAVRALAQRVTTLEESAR